MTKYYGANWQGGDDPTMPIDALVARLTVLERLVNAQKVARSLEKATRNVQVEEDYEDAQRQISELETIVGNLQLEHRETEQELRETKQALEDSNEVIAELREDVLEANEEAAEATDRAEKAETYADEVQKESVVDKVKIAYLQERVEALRREIEQLKGGGP